jgi:hypothetical protein
MGEDLESLKQRLPLLDYLRQLNWRSRPTGPVHKSFRNGPIHRNGLASAL